MYNWILLTKSYCHSTSMDFQPSDLCLSVAEQNEDVTLYDIFYLVHYANLLVSSTSKMLGMPHFDQFWDQINKNKDSDNPNILTHLKLDWRPWTGKEGKTYLTPRLMSFQGIAPGCPDEAHGNHQCNKNCRTHQTSGISLTPLNNLGHLPVLISPELIIPNSRAKIIVRPTLQCLISSIFFELTVMGDTPDKVGRQRQIIDDSIKETKQAHNE